jgi:hypothetical protein
VVSEKIFKNRPIWNKNCLWRPCLLMVRDEISNLYRGPSIDASYQVSVHLAEGFQRRRLKCERLKDDGWQTTDAKWWLKVTLPLARWAKNVSDGIGKTSIVRHLVLLLSLLCVLLLSHFVAGNKVHGWIFKFHSVLWFIVCMLCLLLVHVYYSVGFKRLLEFVL